MRWGTRSAPVVGCGCVPCACCSLALGKWWEQGARGWRECACSSRKLSARRWMRPQRSLFPFVSICRSLSAAAAAARWSPIDGRPPRPFVAFPPGSCNDGGQRAPRFFCCRAHSASSHSPFVASSPPPPSHPTVVFTARRPRPLPRLMEGGGYPGCGGGRPRSFKYIPSKKNARRKYARITRQACCPALAMDGGAVRALCCCILRRAAGAPVLLLPRTPCCRTRRTFAARFRFVRRAIPSSADRCV